MSSDSVSPKSRKIPVWVWVVGVIFLLLLIIGLISGGGESEESVTEPASVSESIEPVETVVEEENASPEEDTASESGASAIETVKQRFEADCFAGLGSEFSYRYEVSPDEMREGYVYVSVDGDVLQFAVGLNPNTGAFLTFPSNDFTVEKLSEAGC